MKLFPKRWSASPRRSGEASRRAAAPLFDPTWLAIAFVLLGGAFRYLVIVPAEWGQSTITVPGALTAIGSLVDVGFGLIALLVARGRRKSLVLFLILLWPPHVFVSVLSLSKANIIIALLFPVIGAYAGHRNLGQLAIRLAAIAAIFTISQNWIAYGRSVVYERTQTIYQADYEERIEILTEYISTEQSKDSDVPERQGWWTRLNFSQVQAFAMNAYDHGHKGESIQNVWMYFIPRAIWPEKPIMVGPGLAFYEIVTGRPGKSFLGLSIYGDLYWQFGWAGIWIGCPLIGLLLAMMGWRSLAYIRDNDFIRLPLVLMAFEMATLAPNKFVINGIIGALPIYVVYLLMINFSTSVLSGRAKRSERRRVYRRQRCRTDYQDC